jgi:hypothetical protein
MMTRPGAPIFPPATFAERANANNVASSEVKVAGDRGGADVVPVGVLRGKFFRGAGFDEFDLGWDFELACTGG